MLKFITLAIAILLAVIFIYAATKPDTFQIQRTETIKAPPEKIFALIEDFHKWAAWSPWEKMDPAMKRMHSGAESGAGAVYAWEGNSKVGEGRMEIAEAVPSSRLTIKLDFLKPFEAHNTAVFTLESTGDSTDITWTMSGPSPYLSKLMGVFVNLDRMVGKDFEAGLANLKALAEG